MNVIHNSIKTLLSVLELLEKVDSLLDSMSLYSKSLVHAMQSLNEVIQDLQELD